MVSSKTPSRSMPAAGEVRAALVDLLGPERVRADAALEGVLVASATSVDEVREVLAVARTSRVPILARAGDLDTAGLTAPTGGGILLDLSGMNRVVEVNHSERYAVVEPGVTWRRLDARLVEDGGDLALPTAATPAHLSVWSSIVMDGVGTGTSLGQGTLGEAVWGVEAVGAAGDLVRTGVGSVTGGWWGRGPLPDLTGLFLGWHGATGLVTRIALSLRKRKRYQRRLVLPASTRRVAIAGAIRAAREGLFDEALVLPWSLPRLLLGVRGALRRDATEPEAYLHIDFTADTRPELEYKRLRLGQALSRASRRGGDFDEPVTLDALARGSDRLRGLSDLPLKLPDPEPGERWSILGCHGPTSKLVDAADEVEAAYVSAGLMPTVMVRPVHGGHFGIVHAVSAVHRDPDADLGALRAAQGRALEALLALGFLPHRFSPELGRTVVARMHPGSQRVAMRLKRLLDPEGLLDPSRWGLPAPA